MMRKGELIAGCFSVHLPFSLCSSCDTAECRGMKELELFVSFRVFKVVFTAE
jgi:hypothetical protein